ncbi:MAG: response regulator, partial [Peptococcaceae bacterium]|nr:response regulator [Peptococcaceae bacterium]
HFLVEDKDIDFQLILQGDIPKYLYGDDVRLRQVLLNLLGNAVKFTTKGFVHLTFSAMDTSILITVSDTGIGIHADDLERLFDAFEQVDSFKNRSKTGTGLGLSITKGIVEMMGGHISVESEYGHGTSLYVEIPKILGDGALIMDADNDDISIYAPDAKILLVDDNLINLNVASGHLRLCHIKADTATSGMEAIELIKQNQYDIVFMDYRMPEMNGVEAARIIRGFGKTVTIVALTASAVVGAKEMMLESGMDDFLTKPIIKAELKKMLKKWIPAEKLSFAPPGTRAPGSTMTEDREDAHKDFWEKIAQIEEISLAIGMDRIDGQKDIYKKSLQLMIGDIGKSDKNLRRFLAEEDMHNFRIEVHSVKSSLANLGAMELSTKAFELETASSRLDVGFCTANLPSLLDELEALSVKIEEAFATISHSEMPLTVSPEALLALEKLMKALVEMDLVQIGTEMEGLCALNLDEAFEEEIEKLQDEITMMDYDSAIEHIAELLNDV